MAPIAVDTLMDRIEQLGRLSEDPDMLVRRSYSPEMRRAHELVGAWMRDAGMAVREDAAGNLIGRYKGATEPGKTLILGSHLDSVRDAGRYDGPLGVLAGIACVERLRAEGRRLPFAIEVISFADEEGLRFHSSFLGSSAVAGSFNRATLDLVDDDEIALAEAMRSFGGNPDLLAGCAVDAPAVLGYCEVHIEQGPVLDAEDLPVGIVDAIAAQSRFTIECAGVSGHAGTVPMAIRRDALCAAAEVVLAAEALGRKVHNLVATVGQLAAEPGASNVIPGRVELSLDIRHRNDEVLHTAVATLIAESASVADRRGVAIHWMPMQATVSVPCSSELMARLAAATQAAGYPVRYLSSGAGHDGVPLSAVMPIAMLFVRCKGGVSHNPAESVRVEDVAVALDVLHNFVISLATVSPSLQ